MKLTSLQWNIGGGKIREPGVPHYSDEAYKKNGLDHIISIIKQHSPDVVTLQEAHENEIMSQGKHIAAFTGMQYAFTHNYNESHIEPGQDLTLCILSKYPIRRPDFKFFYNPKYTKELPNGEIWVSHHKGMLEVKLDVNGKDVNVTTLHLIPFKRFDIDPYGEKSAKVREDIEQKLKANGEYNLIQGDFNVNDESLQRFLPSFIRTVQEVPQTQATTPSGWKYDHVLYRGLKHLSSKVITEALTDHYPVYSEFEF
jgi:endonuclease/exonuclease/phosphatase (EEP) superfamily protein YafD